MRLTLSIKRMAGILMLGGILFPGLAAAAQGPATPQQLAERMIAAHGGMAKWKAAPTVSFTHIMFQPGLPEGNDPWWIHLETVEQGQRRTYQDWPLDNAQLVNDGKTVWTTNWNKDNPPRFMSGLTYYFLNLPWLTQDPGVILTGPGKGKLPDNDKEFLTLRMTYEGPAGDTPDDYYVIYIDPETYRMAGTEYVVTYATMLDLFKLPPEAKFLGPIYHVFDDFTTVDGLTLPSRYHTHGPDGKVIYGEHTVLDISFEKPFDESRLEMPEGAVIDTSDPKKRKRQPAP